VKSHDGVSPQTRSSSMSNTIALYPLSNFTFSTKEAQPEEDPSVSARLQRLQNNYEDFGMRRTVEGILVVHDHGHPHILMLQIANAFFKLPGDYLKPGEDDVSGLKRKLDERLAPPAESKQFDESHGIDNDWEIGDCLAQWWRPNFETFMYPFVPAHITKPKECKKMYLVQMPERSAYILECLKRSLYGYSLSRRGPCSAQEHEAPCDTTV
jgi:cleavage and polyadenylation specificity factor subunit 5